MNDLKPEEVLVCLWQDADVLPPLREGAPGAPRLSPGLPETTPLAARLWGQPGAPSLGPPQVAVACPPQAPVGWGRGSWSEAPFGGTQNPLQDPRPIDPGLGPGSGCDLGHLGPSPGWSQETYWLELVRGSIQVPRYAR